MSQPDEVRPEEGQETGNATLVIGSDKQSKYIHDMAARAKVPSVMAVCVEVLGRSAQNLLQNPPTTTEARQVIQHLQAKLDSAQQATATSLAGSSSLLRRYAEQGEAPADLDEDSLWIVTQLQRADRARAALAGEQIAIAKHQPQGFNSGKRIEVEHLLKYFKSWDNLADAFKVTVPTAKAWGQYVPENRIYEAEVRTNGFVRVPRNHRGLVA